jgi:hypothetical protein
MSERTPNEHAEWLEQQTPSCPPAPQIEIERLRAQRDDNTRLLAKQSAKINRLRAIRDELLFEMERIYTQAGTHEIRDQLRAVIAKANEQP